MTVSKLSGLRTFTLVMLISGAVDSIRNLPATALFGTSLIFFFVLSSIIFLIPAALISAELSSKFTEKSGIFHWVRIALGEKLGFFAVWLQWLSNVVWFPTILSFIAATATYMMAPDLAKNKTYLIMMVISIFWLLTILNLRGINTSAKFSSFCVVIGIVIPMAVIILLGGMWLISGNPSNIHFTANNIIPNFGDGQNWISLTAIMTAFLGIELSAVHINDVHNPQKTFPKALFYSVLLILSTMILGSLAIAIVLPKDKINLINGVMQAFTDFFAMYHISWLMPIMTILIAVGTCGGIISWIISPVKGLLQGAQYGFLPEFFKKENRHGVPANLLIAQAILVSFICLAFLLMPSINSSYWLLTALSTQTYMIMYVLMFISGIRLYKTLTAQKTGFCIPGGKYGLIGTCLLGLSGCFITMTVGFIPPSSMDVGSLLHYELIFLSSIVMITTPVLICIFYRSKFGLTTIKEDFEPLAESVA